MVVFQKQNLTIQVRKSKLPNPKSNEKSLLTPDFEHHPHEDPPWSFWVAAAVGDAAGVFLICLVCLGREIFPKFLRLANFCLLQTSRVVLVRLLRCVCLEKNAFKM